MSVYPSVCGGYGVAGPPGPPGAPGPQGTFLDSWRGPWSPVMDYAAGDLVQHNGSTYVLTLPPSVPNQMYGILPFRPEPPEDPWDLVAAGGYIPPTEDDA